MSDDEWVDKIHKERSATQEARRTQDALSREAQQVFREQADRLWKEIADELGRVFTLYNRGAAEDVRVEFDPAPLAMGAPEFCFTAGWAGTRALRVLLDKERGVVRVQEREALPSQGWRERQAVGIVATKRTLGLRGTTVSDFCRRAIEPFLRHIG